MIALMVVMGVAGLGACLLQYSTSMTRNQVQAIDKKRAFYIAEAGLSESIYGLMAGVGGNVGSPTAPARFGDGVLWTKAVETTDGRIRIESNGLCGGGRASLSTVVEWRSGSTAELGIFSHGDLVVKKGSVIDSYDPNAQAPAGGGGGGLLGGLLGGGGADDGTPTPNSAGRIGSNGNIEVQGSSKATTRIDGDVTPGPDHTVTSSKGVTITGSTTPRTEPIVLPAIEVPELISLGKLVQKGTRTMTMSAGEHRYESLTVSEGSKLVITGPQTLVVDSLVLKKDAKLVLDTSEGGIEIYVTNYVNFAKGTTVDNTEHDPALARFLITASGTADRTGDGIADPPVTISSKEQIYATIYAPDASVTLSNSLEFFGAITAASLGLSEGAKLHFDEALLEDDGSGPDMLKMLSWRTFELPDAPLVKSRIDPVVALRLQGAALTSPFGTHQAVNFKITFVNLLGETLSWAGDEFQFDWTQVQSVVKTSRTGDSDFDGGLLGLVTGILGLLRLPR